MKIIIAYNFGIPHINGWSFHGSRRI